MKKLENLNGELFSQLNVNEMKNVLGGYEAAASNTYATSGVGGDTPPANVASDTWDSSTGTSSSDWVNLYPNGYSKRPKIEE